MDDNTNSKKFSIIKKYLTKKTLGVITLVIILLAVSFGLGKMSASESKTTKLGFEDIGELATQAAFCTEVNVTDASRDLFGIKIPFTQSKYIYSYDIVIKAGFNFSEIDFFPKENSMTIKMPQPKILSTDPDFDSFKVYHEDESIFRQVSLTENNDAIKKLEEKAEKGAISNGLLENAKANAEAILSEFAAKEFGIDKKNIKFEYKK